MPLHLHAQTLQGVSPSPQISNGSPQTSTCAGDFNRDPSQCATATDANIGNGTSERSNGSGGENDTGFETALPANQILNVLKEQPDALLEVKSLMASLAQQQGVAIEQNSITDEMLYSKIATSPDFRVSITNFLRARGYVSTDELSGDTEESYEKEDELIQSNSRIAPSRFPAQAIADEAGRNGSQGTSRLGLPSSVTGDRRNVQRGAKSSAINNPQVLHQPTPHNLLSLRDLYVQLPEQTGQLKRFGSDVFLHQAPRSSDSTNQVAPNAHEIPLDVPAGPSYVVGPGDTLSIELWGGISQSLTRVIDREGRISLPDSGSLQVAGLTLEQVQDVLAESLSRQYRNLRVAVTVAHLRSIRVYVVGDVQRPGAYDISSLSTSLNALYAAGGPTNIGSLRTLRHYRGKQLVGDIDLYDFLLHGVQSEDRMQSGDTLLVPPAGPQVAVDGAVKRPAIYELKGAATLASLLDDAGGTTVAAELGHIVVDRVDANRQRETVSVDLPASHDTQAVLDAIAAFAVRDGDRIHVSSILPYSQAVVYTAGHVVRPGRMAYRDGMRLSDVLHSYRDLLPEPADKGEIVRLVAPDLHPETIDFNVPDTLIGNNNLLLQPFDTIRIYGRYEADPPRVTIGGEVLRPGTYALSSGMTAAQLVRMAGGFKRDALLDSADLISYQISGGTRVASQRTSVSIGDAVLHEDHSTDVQLKAGDVLTVHQIAGWNDIGSSLTIEGEVAHPGIYGIQQGERLSSVLKRAGGLRETSYPAGAVLLRDEVRKLEEKSREELIRQIESSSAAARIGPNLASGDQSATVQLIAQQQEQVLAKLKSQPASGRLVIHINADIASWENTPDDIEVRAGDVLRIPKRPGFVLVSGQVYNASAITFTPDKTASWYLRNAGGATETANTKDIFIIRANGSVVGRESRSWFSHDVLATRLDPGDVVVVPQKIIGASLFWRNLLTVGQITSSIAITAAVAGLL